MISENSEEGRLMRILKPYLDNDKMDDLFEQDEDKYYEYQDELMYKYGVGVPLKENAPSDIVAKYKRLGEIHREQERTGKVY